MDIAYALKEEFFLIVQENYNKRVLSSRLV